MHGHRQHHSSQRLYLVLIQLTLRNVPAKFAEKSPGDACTCSVIRACAL